MAVEPGDYVVLSTDGLFDNVPDPMIIEEVVSIRVRRSFHVLHMKVVLNTVYLLNLLSVFVGASCFIKTIYNMESKCVDQFLIFLMT